MSLGVVVVVIVIIVVVVPWGACWGELYTPGRGHVRSDHPDFYRLAAHHLMHEPCKGALSTFGDFLKWVSTSVGKQEQITNSPRPN